MSANTDRKFRQRIESLRSNTVSLDVTERLEGMLTHADDKTFSPSRQRSMFNLLSQAAKLRMSTNLLGSTSFMCTNGNGDVGTSGTNGAECNWSDPENGGR